MGGDAAGRDWTSLLSAAEAVAPVDAVAAELADRLGAEEVSFLVADYSGDALVRLSRAGAGVGSRSRGEDVATTVPLNGSVYEQAVRSQRVRVLAEEGWAGLVSSPRPSIRHVTTSGRGSGRTRRRSRARRTHRPVSTPDR